MTAFNFKYTDCPICNMATKPWRTIQNEYGKYTITICNGCHYAFVNPRPTLELIQNIYSTTDILDNIDPESLLENEKSHPNSTIDSERVISNTLKLSDKADLSLLDVGCGHGFMVKTAIEKGLDVTSLEISEPDSRIAERVSGIKPIITTFENYNQEPRLFDVIILSQILEHAYDVNVWAQKAFGLLNSNGLICIALPNFDNVFRYLLQEKEPYITPPIHLNYFNKRNLSLLLENHGFEIIKTDYVSRLPVDTFSKKLPKKIMFLAVPTVKTVNRLLKIIDYMGLGIMLNVYARKK